MRSLRNALLAACAVALPVGLAAAAHAQQPQAHGIMLYMADGTPFGILTPVGNGARLNMQAESSAPGVLSVEQIMQRQDALIDQMFAQMRAMFGAPFGLAMPGGNGPVTVSALQGMPQGFCGQSVTYTFDGRSSQPKVQVQTVGDACGAPGALRSVPADVETAPKVTRPAPATRMYNVMYRQPAATVVASR